MRYYDEKGFWHNYEIRIVLSTFNPDLFAQILEKKTFENYPLMFDPELRKDSTDESKSRWPLNQHTDIISDGDESKSRWSLEFLGGKTATQRDIS